VDDESDWADPIRVEIRTWLAQNWNPAQSVDEWWKSVAIAGWALPHFPADRFGRGLPRSAQSIVREEFRAFDALPPPGGLGLLMAAPTILTFGTAEQIEWHAVPTLAGARAWCQLFSEPGSGSDLAGLTTRAERDGDAWRINGQKVWSSHAVESNFGMLIARTDFGVPKHQGISWFALDLDQPGIEIRPIREMTGHALFNEVFFDDAICPAENLIGGEGNGWAVAKATLDFERGGIGAGGGYSSFPYAGTKGGLLTLGSAGEAAKALPRPDDQGPGDTGAITVPELVELARAAGVWDDPYIRDRIVTLATYVSTGEWMAARALQTTDPVELKRLMPLAKLAQVRISKTSADVGIDVLGSEGLLWKPDGAAAGRYTEGFAAAASYSIGGGTDQIHKNIIAERGLDMPREEDLSRAIPYREVLNRIRDSRRP
jgi:alkylation response protein AidB-like acyl-CoA dehydrogenase